MLTPAGPARAGVQLPLRRPRDAGDPAAAGERSGGRCSSLHRGHGSSRPRPAGSRGAAATVVAACAGYPGSYAKGRPIDRHRAGRGHCRRRPSSTPARAGATDGRLLTDGGRVLAVTGTGADLRQALDRAYAGIEPDPLRGHALPPRHRREGAADGRGGSDDLPGCRRGHRCRHARRRADARRGRSPPTAPRCCWASARSAGCSTPPR